MTHNVNFTVKNVDETSPDYKLIDDRSQSFKTFNAAMKFTRELKAKLNRRETLVGLPVIEEAA